MKSHSKNMKKHEKTHEKKEQFSRGPDFGQNIHIPEEKPLPGDRRAAKNLPKNMKKTWKKTMQKSRKINDKKN